MRNQPERAKLQIHNDAGNYHGSKQDAGDIKCGLRSIVFPANQNQRNDDQVRVNKGNDTAKADAARPQDAGERDVAAGTSERGRADQRPDDGVFNQAQRTGFMGDK